tara:strand:- start:243 stop:392 length:150 start_codon:yes stop_codon:yes gene_type:complete
VEDTLKTVTVGTGGSVIGFFNWFPELVSIIVGITTLVYLIIKIRKDLKN